MISRAETLALDWVSSCIARSQFVKGSLLDSNIVPPRTLHRYRQPAHCQ